MYKGLNCDRKSHLSEILTELLNPRDLTMDIGFGPWNSFLSLIFIKLLAIKVV